jgi:hypothetical protein
MKHAKEKYYLLVIWNDVEPELLGPYDTVEAMDTEAREIRKQDGEKRHGLFPVEATGRVSIGGYSGAYLDSEEEETT